jgi:DNA topoisomerase I
VADSAAESSSAISELYEDVRRCAEAVGLEYVQSDTPGITRLRNGRGFSYRAADGTTVSDAAMKQRIADLAIPPAWRKVWICPSPDGHLLATGEDARGRKQYLYHPQWREWRDLLNAYRLAAVAEHLPAIRAHVAAQLRRRTLDRDRVLATMLRIVDLSGMRIGSEVYAEENDSVGLTTLMPRHVTVRSRSVEFDFPAKSGRRSHVVVRDARVASVVRQLLARRRRRLFTVDGQPVDAAQVNALLSTLTGDRVTAKDFRTWRGTRAAFAYLTSHATDDAHAATIAAVDAAAEELHNTRAVAGEHYVHPHVLDSFRSGTFGDYLAAATPRQHALLDKDEQVLVGFLHVLLESQQLTGTALRAG